MSTEMPIRPSRRPAARRRIVADDSDEEDHRVPSQQNEDEAEYTFPPKTTPRRQPRRKTAEPTSIAPSTTRGRRTKTGESIEPSQIFSPEGNAAPEPPSPSRGSSPRKRTSVTSSRRTRKSSATDIPEVPPLPTPKPSQSPEPPASQNTPLADITSATVNNRGAEQLQPSEVSSQKPMERPLEEPKDILLKSQNMAIPGPPPAPSGPTSRIVITYLILNNFKSYAGRQEVGPFHASFSSVVGPNGSGKSNVIDSLLFVFGFRASKMRQGKISALIHNSAAFPNLEFCEVEVHFEEVIDLPGGKHEIVPNSALVISRRAYKNNTSKYFINGKESNFTVVTTLLRDRGVDLDHKRFLILQGEVESIAQMKPKAANEHDDGLLEYLEDIIGTSKYKTPIEESAAELETLNEVCHEKSNRVQHVEKEKNSLEDKKNKALAYIREENDLATKQSALYQIYISECEDNLKVTEEAITQMQAQLKEELEKHQGNEDGIKQMEKLYKKGAKEYEAMEAETQALLKEMAKIDKENVKFEEKKKFLAGKQKKFEKALQGSRLGGSEAETVIKNCLEDVARSSEQIAELEKSMKQEEEELATIREGLKGKTQAFSDQIAVKQKSLEPWKAKINEKQSAIAVAQSELDILRERNNAGETKLKEVQAKIDEIKRNGQAKEQELEGCKARREELTQHTEAVEKELNKLSQKEAGYRNQVSGARQKADEARASLSNTQTQGNVLTGLMRLKESGRVEGFHGRLGNLGAIDEKYDVAISTACPSLDNLVVDSVEVGQQCIDYLRKNNLGRAQFILLDRLPKRDLSSINTPEGVPRLFDLVKSKHDKFRPAFFSVLQNTLVADDLAQANRIAYGAQRWRVVTLDGQLIDKSGTMSGGGTRVAKGAMSSKLAGEVTRERVAKLEGDREALEQAFQIFLDRQRELETSLRESKEEIGPLETTMQKIAMEIQSCARQLNDARRRRQEIAEENQPSPEDNDRMASLEKKIVGLNKEIEKLHAETAGVEAEIKELQDKIMEVGGVRLRAQKARVDGIREQIDTLNEEISTAEVAKTKAEKQVAKQFKAMKEAEKELESVAEEAQKLEEAIKTQTRDSSGSRDKAEEAQEVCLQILALNVRFSSNP
ncbi:hypothetical protein L228DRAFT_162357 [Xylona heveae TC161]|uniref:SMC hinge domain-containing protein n=1 Tax=Xylona heveae (strain CBS 132557 / TC161) TaxID=1328760 RepID=A0A165G920_XYLHT|nr:hypothetical protein L228DRAFT_162357 [Xylona heveae TC161]KZF21893.1 hypothetical protein L228DRAFT_162357 [Xylona heveae TC161]